MNTTVATERLVKDLKVVGRDAEDLLKATASDVGDKTREARTRLAAAYATAKDSCCAKAKATDKVIRQYPYPVAGVALGIGFLVGFLVSRRTHR